jgi:hypothetical protein
MVTARPLWSAWVAFLLAVAALVASHLLYGIHGQAIVVHILEFRESQIVPSYVLDDGMIHHSSEDAMRIPPQEIAGKVTVLRRRGIDSERFDFNLKGHYQRSVVERCHISLVEPPRREPIPALEMLPGFDRIEELERRVKAAAERPMPPPDEQQVVVLYDDSCDVLARELPRIGAALSTWMAGDRAQPFDAEASTMVRGVPWALLPLIVLMVLIALLRSFAVDVQKEPDGSLVVAWRFGPRRKVVARLLRAELRGVQVITTKMGPFYVHCPALLVKGRGPVRLWPWSRKSLRLATAAREQLLPLVGAADFTDAEAPYR